jgi:probable HAF family extracellular repeat protein
MVSRIVRTRHLSRLAPLVTAAFLLSSGDTVPAQSAPVPTYTVLGFGTLGGASTTFHGIHDFASDIVGESKNAAGTSRAVIVRFGVLTDLGTLGGPSSAAFASYYGTVVGQAQTASLQTHAFRFDNWTASGPGPLVDLGTLGGTFSAAYGTDGSSIVGASTRAGSSRVHAFVYASGTMSALPVDAGGDSAARDVLYEQIVGYACTAGNASCRAFWVKEGASTTLPSLGGNAIANAINDREQIVGVSATANAAVSHAFLYSGGVLTDLGTLGGANSEALAVNTRGEIVGWSGVAGGGTHAFLWRDGALIDLNDALPSGSGWVLRKATAISDGGQIAGEGTFNGSPRAFLLTPPFDVMVWPGGQRSQSDSNLPRGVEAGRNIRFVNSVIGRPDPVTIYGARLTATLTGPAEYIAVRSYDGDATECHLAARAITCELLPIDTVGFGPEYQFTIRTTGPGAITHTATVASGTPDTNPGNDRVIENNRAVALAGLALTPSALPGGKASSAHVTLTDLPPGGDAVVRMSSSRPDIAPVPATIVVPYHNNSPSRAFNIVPGVVSQPTAVDISATYGGVSITKRLTVMPTTLQQLYLTPTTVIGGCGTASGKIALNGAAPPGGAVVTLTNTNAKASVPLTVLVPAGALSKTFTVPTSTVTSNQAGSVTASYGGVSQTLTLTVRPIRVATLLASPNPVTGGGNATATIALECAAPAGGVVVSLSSSKASVVAPAVSNVTIPAGATSATFALRTSRVTANTSVNVYATVYGVRKTAAVLVRP